MFHQKLYLFLRLNSLYLMTQYLSPYYNIKTRYVFFLFALYQLSYLPMTGRIRFELTTTDFADQRKIFAVRILMAVPRRIELRSLDRQSSIMATIRWNYILHFTSLPYIAFSAVCHISVLAHLDVNQLTLPGDLYRDRKPVVV